MHTFTYQSIQTAGSTFALPRRTRYISVSGASLRSKHSLPGIHLSAGRTVVGYLYCQGLWVLQYLESELLVRHPDQVLLCNQSESQLQTTLRMVGFKTKCSKIRTGASLGHTISGHSASCGSGQKDTPRLQSSGDSNMAGLQYIS